MLFARACAALGGVACCRRLASVTVVRRAAAAAGGEVVDVVVVWLAEMIALECSPGGVVPAAVDAAPAVACEDGEAAAFPVGWEWCSASGGSAPLWHQRLDPGAGGP